MPQFLMTKMTSMWTGNGEDDEVMISPALANLMIENNEFIYHMWDGVMYKASLRRHNDSDRISVTWVPVKDMKFMHDARAWWWCPLRQSDADDDTKGKGKGKDTDADDATKGKGSGKDKFKANIGKHDKGKGDGKGHEDGKGHVDRGKGNGTDADEEPAFGKGRERSRSRDSPGTPE